MTIERPKIKIVKHWQRLYTTKKRYIILTGGRGSAKSFTVMLFSLQLTYEQGHNILYTRYTMTSAEKTIIPLFRDMINKYFDYRDFHITQSSITNKRTGVVIYFSGIKTSSGDQTGNLKTLPNITTWVIEEGEDYNKEDSFTDIDDSIRLDGKQLRVIWIQNPSTAEHFIYKRFFEQSHTIEKINGFEYQQSTHPQVEHIHTTYHINKANLDAEKVASWDALALTNPKKYQHKYIGSWLDKAEGVIFENWSEGEFPEHLPYCYGQDYGFSVDPTTLIRVAVDKTNKIIYAHECLYSEGKQLGTDELAQITKSRLLRSTDLIIGDDHGQQQRVIKDLEKSGINIKGCTRYAKSIVAGITKMQDYRLVITPESHNIKKELNNYTWNDKKAGIPSEDYNHAIDSIRYAFEFLTYGGGFGSY